MSLSRAEKERIIKALEEDREFRYALMGLLGFKELLERFARLEERQQRLEERLARLEERQQRLEERQQRLEEEMIETRRVLMVIAHRFGVISEAGLREALKYVVQDILGVATVERKVIRDDEGIVYGHPAIVEVDVVVKDKEHILVEIKSRVSRGDVAELYRIGKVYEKLYTVKPRLMIIGGFIDVEARESASRLNIEIKPATKLD